DGAVDPLGSLGCKPVYSDMDSDGFGFAYLLCSCEGAAPGQNQSELPGDCDDGDPDMSPWMLEYCDDRDNNCNGALDEGCDDDGDWWCDMQLPVDGTPDVCPYGSGDCLDMLNHANPAAEELAADGLDNDCDGETDEVVAALVFSCPPGCVGNTLPVYLCAMEMCFDQFIVSSAMSSPTNDNISTAWAAVSHFGSPANDLAPLAGDSYSLLASGPATGTFHSQDLPGGTSISDPFANDGFSTHDNVELNVTLTAPPTATGFAMDYIFFSEEYEEYIGSSFNDKFYIILKAPVTTSNVKKVINFTACSNPGSYWDFIDPGGQKVCYIAINTAFSEPCSNVQTDISGTGFQCGGGGSSNGSSTGWLTTEWSIQAGETFTLTFHIHDASDGIYDSEVILDNFHWLQGDVDEGTKPHF
ncbi:MAG: choice-of-anchor L domain-containing protein, partial [Deltaproteobacteria bacterium]|nr:choice-of-anchor L domain-containing protein [Deltaproteobacteria bacterium]